MMRWAVILILVVLTAALAAVTRLRLPAAQLEVATVDWRPSLAASERGRKLDRMLAERRRILDVDEELGDRLMRAEERVVTLRHFWVDRCEVSQADFEKFLKWRAENPEPNIRSRWEPRGWRYDTTSRGHRIGGRLNSPASGVTYFDAYAYCRAAGGRLPSADEWQAVAGGRQGRLYPWGDEFSDNSWPYVNSELNAAQRCGVHPGSDTPQGVHDMAGNAMEWSSGDARAPASVWQPMLHGAPADAPKNRAVRALNALAVGVSPLHRSNQVGFRCVYESGRRLATPAWRPHRARRRMPDGEYRLGLPADARLPKLVEVASPKLLGEIVESLRKQEKGAGGVALRRFKLAKCEVSRALYGAFLSDPLVSAGLFANEAEPEDAVYEPLLWREQLSRPQLPVSGVSWWAANAFARWVGGRLPSVEEWDIAAGAGRRRYPWGDDYDPTHVISGDVIEAQVSACGGAEGDITDIGIRDMGGNVSEWTRSVTLEDARYAIWLKGGSFLLPGRESAQVGFARAVPPDHRAADIGFRVLFD